MNCFRRQVLREAENEHLAGSSSVPRGSRFLAGNRIFRVTNCVLRSLGMATPLLLSGCSEGTYAGHCDTPLSHWRKPSDGLGHYPRLFRVEITDAGDLKLDGRDVEEGELVRLMDVASEMVPRPVLILEPDQQAPCGRVSEIRALMNSRYCHLRGVCGEGRGSWLLSYP